MSEGMICSWDDKRKYGWICSPQDYIYFHIANCLSGFKPMLGMIVAYEKAPPFRIGKGEQATGVHYVGNRCLRTISGEIQCDLRELHNGNHFSRSADIFWDDEHSDKMQNGDGVQS